MVKFFFSLILLAGMLFAAVDINSADAKTLATLKKIGPKKAARIVKYREKHGCFKDFKAFRKVKGINKKTLKKNKGNIVVGPCTQ